MEFQNLIFFSAQHRQLLCFILVKILQKFSDLACSLCVHFSPGTTQIGTQLGRARARAQIVHSDSLCPRMGMFTFFFRARAQSEQSEHANFENFLEFFNQNKTQKLPMLGGEKNKF